MTTDLVQRLRTCSAQERRAIALELAQAGTDKVINELMGMAEAGVRTYAPRTWKTLWLRKVVRYNLDDQLAGIEALGETTSKTALDYLRHVAEEHEFNTSSSYGQMQGSDFYPDYWYTHYYYPNAHGEMGSRLSFDGPSYGMYGPDERYDEELKRLKGENLCHKTLEVAIQKLEAALQKKTSPDHSTLERSELSPSDLASLYLGSESSYMDEHGQVR